MSDNGGMYEFGHFVLDVEQRSFTKDGQRISLKPKTFDVLTVLLQRANRAASKDEIIRAVWHDSFVEEGNLAVHISTLRKIFSANGDRNIYIETVPKMGYRLITERSAADAVSDATDQGQDAENPSAPIPQIPKGRSRRTAWTIFFTGMVVGILAAGSVAYYSVRLNFGPKMHGSFETVQCPRDALRSNLVAGGCEEAVAAFAITSNPKGNWSYGYTPKDDFSAFALFERAVSKHFGSPEVPSDSWSRTGEWLPSILRNTTPYTVVIQDGVVVPPHMFEMHPGPNGERSVLRWTAPVDGHFRIQGQFRGLNTTGYTTTDGLVLFNAKEVYFSAKNITGYNIETSFGTAFNAKAGDTIDFSVGYGANEAYECDSTGFSVIVATISVDGATETAGR